MADQVGGSRGRFGQGRFGLGAAEIAQSEERRVHGSNIRHVLGSFQRRFDVAGFLVLEDDAVAASLLPVVVGLIRQHGGEPVDSLRIADGSQRPGGPIGSDLVLGGEQLGQHSSSRLMRLLVGPFEDRPSTEGRGAFLGLLHRLAQSGDGGRSHFRQLQSGIGVTCDKDPLRECFDFGLVRRWFRAPGTCRTDQQRSEGRSGQARELDSVHRHLLSCLPAAASRWAMSMSSIARVASLRTSRIMSFSAICLRTDSDFGERRNRRPTVEP